MGKAPTLRHLEWLVDIHYDAYEGLLRDRNAIERLLQELGLELVYGPENNFAEPLRIKKK